MITTVYFQKFPEPEKQKTPCNLALEIMTAMALRVIILNEQACLESRFE